MNENPVSPPSGQEPPTGAGLAPAQDLARVDIHIDLAPGERVQVIVESRPGETVQVTTTPLPPPPSQPASANLTRGPRQRLPGLRLPPLHLPHVNLPHLGETRFSATRLSGTEPARWLFGIGLLLYAVLHLVGLERFPISATADEVASAVRAAGLLKTGLLGPESDFLPTFFFSRGAFSLGTSVYVQLLPILLFGRSLFAVRAVSGLLTLLAAAWIALLLRDGMKTPYWWTAPLLLAAVPVWLMNSRTGLEAPLFVSLYAGFLYFYLKYRQGSVRALFISLVLGALAFYAYAPGQVVVVVTGLLLLLLDGRYHWQQRKAAIYGVYLVAALALPLARFLAAHPSDYAGRLERYGSYWASTGTLPARLWELCTHYLSALNPAYWFLPDPNGSPFFTLGGYAYFPWWMFVLVVLGLWQTVRSLREPPARLVLVALLAAPAGAALADLTPIRALAMLVPLVLLSGAGLTLLAGWIEDLGHRRWLTYSLLVLLVAVSPVMLSDALAHGTTWYHDYGIQGVQYGAQQVFQAVQAYQAKDPSAQVMISPGWAFDVGMLRSFFLPNPDLTQVGTPDLEAQTMDPDLGKRLYVLTAADLDSLRKSGLFTDPQPLQVIPYPDGTPAFFLVRLTYRPGIEQIFEARRIEHHRLVSDRVNIDGQDVTVQHTQIDGDLRNAFDGDPNTLIKTLQINPLVLELSFPTARDVKTVRLHTGSEQLQVTVTVKAAGRPDQAFSVQAGEGKDYKTVPVDLPPGTNIQQLRIELLDVKSDADSFVHLWDVELVK